MKKTSYFLFFFLVLMGGILLYRIVSTDYSDSFSSINPPSKRTLNIDSLIYKVDSNNLVLNLNSHKYLCYGNYMCLPNLRNDIGLLIGKGGDRRTGLKIFFNTLTDSLKTQWALSPEYSPDTLLHLLKFAEKFRGFTEIDPENEILYFTVSNYWFNYISDQLSQAAVNNSELKYDYRFKYLINRLAENNYKISITNSLHEKFVLNLIGSKWGYLFNRFWNSTGLILKLGFILGLIISLYGYYCIVKQNFLSKIEK